MARFRATRSARSIDLLIDLLIDRSRVEDASSRGAPRRAKDWRGRACALVRARIKPRKMSVYVMHAPLDNWHTRGNQANAPVDPPGCARG